MTSAKVLIVEDEALIAEEIRLRLSSLGYQVTESVHKADQVFHSIEREEPDVVLMDIVLKGGQDGIQAAVEITSRYGLPIVYLTAYADDKTVQRALDSGASGYLVKPIKEKELRATIELALHRHDQMTQLSEKEHRFRTLFDHATHAMFLIDPERGQFLEINLKAYETLGYSRNELMEKVVSDIHLDDETELARFFESVLEKGTGWTDQLRCRSKDGQVLQPELFAATIKIQGRDCILLTKSEAPPEIRRKNEETQLAATVFNVATQAIFITDADKKIITANPAFVEITGYSLEEVIGKTPHLLSSGRHDRAFYEEMWEAITTIGQWEGEIWNRKKDGTIYPEWLSLVSVKNKRGKILYYTALFSDITTRKLYEERLHFQAYYDSLTRLPNRMLVYERLSQAIIEARRSHGQVALLYANLDGFKEMNDSFGHLFGDRLLKKVAVRLLACTRESDTVARSGGDEFLIVLRGGKKEAGIVSEKILAQLSEPFQIGAHAAFLGVSIGITIAPDDGIEVQKLLNNADMAMYKAKKGGRNRYHFFSNEMEQSTRNRIQIESELEQALANEELVVHYQPIIDLDSLKTLSLEALVRWNHPQQGLLLPARFMPLAEESGMVSKIGNWVFLSACKQIKLWRMNYGLEAALTINVSQREFIYDDFRANLSAVLEESGLAPSSVIIDIEEKLLYTRVEEVMAKLSSVKELGARIAIDDFGTSHSSLEALSRYPVDFLKIDRRFIQNVHADPRKKPLVEAMIRMGQSMKMKVFAEGVERPEDLSYLRGLRCDAAQGNYFSKAVSAEAYEAILKKRRSP